MARKPQIENRFKQLLAQLETETGERPTYNDIQKVTGIAESTLSNYAQGKVSRYDDSTLVEIVKYFDERLKNGCTLADLMQYPPAPGQELSYSTTSRQTAQPAMV